jgi:hypothetical protein
MKTPCHLIIYTPSPLIPNISVPEYILSGEESIDIPTQLQLYILVFSTKKAALDSCNDESPDNTSCISLLESL